MHYGTLRSLLPTVLIVTGWHQLHVCQSVCRPCHAREPANPCHVGQGLCGDGQYVDDERVCVMIVILIACVVLKLKGSVVDLVRLNNNALFFCYWRIGTFPWLVLLLSSSCCSCQLLLASSISLCRVNGFKSLGSGIVCEVDKQYTCIYL